MDFGPFIALSNIICFDNFTWVNHHVEWGTHKSALGMGAILGVRVPSLAGHGERSEAQLRKGDRTWEGSVKRSREPMNKVRHEVASVKLSSNGPAFQQAEPAV